MRRLALYSRVEGAASKPILPGRVDHFRLADRGVSCGLFFRRGDFLLEEGRVASGGGNAPPSQPLSPFPFNLLTLLLPSSSPAASAGCRHSRRGAFTGGVGDPACFIVAGGSGAAGNRVRLLPSFSPILPLADPFLLQEWLRLQPVRVGLAAVLSVYCVRSSLVVFIPLS